MTHFGNKKQKTSYANTPEIPKIIYAGVFPIIRKIKNIFDTMSTLEKFLQIS